MVIWVRLRKTGFWIENSQVKKVWRDSFWPKVQKRSSGVLTIRSRDILSPRSSEMTWAYTSGLEVAYKTFLKVRDVFSQKLMLFSTDLQDYGLTIVEGLPNELDSLFKVCAWKIARNEIKFKIFLFFNSYEIGLDAGGWLIMGTGFMLWPNPTQGLSTNSIFLLFPFCKRSLICPPGNDPL